MRILVTGASGFVGGALLRRLADTAGVEAFGVGRRSLPLAHYAARDLSQPFELPFRPDVVVHAAARVAPWGSPAQFRRQNVDTTARVIDFCRRAGLPRLLLVSSTAVFYREAHQYELDEGSPIGPAFLNDYARSKAEAERLLAGYEGPSCILRPRAVFGPGDTVLLPRLLAAARRGGVPLLVSPGGPPQVDLIHIDTLVEYLLRAAQAPQLGPAYNLTNAAPVDLHALLRRLLGALQLPPPRRRVPAALALRAASVIEAGWRALRLHSEPPITRFGVAAFAYSKTFNPQRMLADLGPPRVSLEDGIERFIDEQRAQWAA
ncbi:NAD(P)-dependent oxidoreductase [Stenotrophomonas sp.]|uniref:NAD-dependent epimerase/dehydratase family protein n=1 Tax=Stenotrophomonas sp. TaxID=69392 RepID=UPI002D399F03|nr:NAD(P)-dependent oxidoreductase [Stenotrophomonas sp.]HYQ24687.1 NAD(P)-dependent oxidoreductase [Stenotrophomonas sp.]